MNSVYRVLPGPPVSRTIKVNTVANTMISMPIYIAPISMSPPRFPIRISATIMAPMIRIRLCSGVIMLPASYRSVPPGADICPAPSSRDLLSSAPSSTISLSTCACYQI